MTTPQHQTPLAYRKTVYLQAYSKWVKSCDALDVELSRHRDAMARLNAAGSEAWDRVVEARMAFEKELGKC